MQCPTDGSALVMSERSGIEIDYCPQCRGVWLDRGELDKIIERGAQMSAPQAAPPQQQRYEEPDMTIAASTIAATSERRRSTGSANSSIRR